jgi:hypothetical protein
MSSEQVAGILRQCTQQVRLVVARSIREPTTTTTTDTPPVTSQRASVTSETLGRTTDNVNLPLTRPSLPMLTDNDGIINNSQNKILLRTERLLENNQNFEKILENLREQVDRILFFNFSRFFFLLLLIDIIKQKEKRKRETINYLRKRV